MLLVVFVVIFSHWRALRFQATFHASGTPPTLLRSLKASTLATFNCFVFSRLFGHSFTASATVLSRHFLPTDVFYLT